jgi:hypothetical protein
MTWQYGVIREDPLYASAHRIARSAQAGLRLQNLGGSPYSGTFNSAAKVPPVAE